MAQDAKTPQPSKTEQPARTSPDGEPGTPAKPRSKTWELIKSLAVAFAIFLVLRTFVIEAFRIPSGSMERTLLIGDFLFVNKALYGAEIPLTGLHLPAFREPRRDDLVIFKSVEEPRLTVVKRVIGMPGDTLSMEDDRLFVDGVAAQEPWVIRTDPLTDHEDPKMRAWQSRYLVSGRDVSTYRPTLKNWGPIVVPADSFFVMGDNRDNSYDSRYCGFLALQQVRARARDICYSYDPGWGVTVALPYGGAMAAHWG